MKRHIVVGLNRTCKNLLADGLLLDRRCVYYMMPRGLTGKDLVIHVAVDFPEQTKRTEMNYVSYLVVQGAEVIYYPEPAAVHDGVRDLEMEKEIAEVRART